MKRLLRTFKLTGITISVLAILFLGTVAYFAFGEWLAGRNKDAFAHLTDATHEFLAISHEAERKQPDLSIRPKAKPVFICRGDSGRQTFGARREPGQVDPLTAELPNALLPETVEEIGTVVSLFWSSEIVGNYGNGSLGRRELCTVKVIDCATRTVIAMRQFQGGAPPGRIKKESQPGVVYGSSCSNDVLSYINTLFVRSPYS